METVELMNGGNVGIVDIVNQYELAMAKIVLDISSCKGCPHFKSERYYTADSWEHAYNWFCRKMDDKKIAGYVEWHEESRIPIPEWCPIKLKSSE